MGSSCKNMACTTTVSGTVLAPNEADPVYNAVVYIPSAPLAPFTQGASCERCGTVSGSPISSAVSGPDGTFQLEVPATDGLPLVVQLGKWRRLVTLPHITACTDNKIDATFTHLPKSQREGDIPLHAVSTGNCDRLECVLRKMGVDDSEFTVPSGGGRIQLFRRNGASLVDIPLATQLSSDAATLNAYDVVLFDCEGVPDAKPLLDKQNVVDFTAAGGRVFASHYSYTWLYDIAPFSTTATWRSGAEFASMDSLAAKLDTSFPRGQAFAEWMAYVGALISADDRDIRIFDPRFDVIRVAPPAQRWIYTESPSSVQQYTFNAPVGAPSEQQCGRVAFTDFHVTGTGCVPENQPFPAECDVPTAKMTPQERVFEFMLLDLASCIHNELAGPVLK